jgi:hypothetical protein
LTDRCARLFIGVHNLGSTEAAAAVASQNGRSKAMLLLLLLQLLPLPPAVQRRRIVRPSFVIRTPHFILQWVLLAESQ